MSLATVTPATNILPYSERDLSRPKMACSQRGDSRMCERNNIKGNMHMIIHMNNRFLNSSSYNTLLDSEMHSTLRHIETEQNFNKTLDSHSGFVLTNSDFLTNISSTTAISNDSGSKIGGGNVSQLFNLRRLSAEIQISFYTIIFVLALVGNLLIIITLIQNKRMRTVTNVYLLNLAISDLLLAIVCMPFTLVPVLLMDFVFGKFMCVFIRYLQAVTVGVSCFTLVAISLERYFAICRPLHSRSWQTLSHAYRCIAVCWILSAALMTPTAVFQKHTSLANGAHRCREIWPNRQAEQAYTILLDLALLVLPVSILSAAYSRVIHVLIFDVRSSGDFHPTTNGKKEKAKSYRMIELRLLKRGSCRSVASFISNDASTCETVASCNTLSTTGTLNSTTSGRTCRRSAGNRIRHSNPNKIRQNKIRVIRMLFVVVMEFFICWTPVYLVQTWIVFHEKSAYQMFTPLSKNLFHLLSYVSSCCNPITYCFMNRTFREAFLRVFRFRSASQSLRDRQEQQSQLTNSCYQREHTRRGTTVLRLSDRLNSRPPSKTTSILLEDVDKGGRSVMERYNHLAISAEELNTIHYSD